ATVVLNDHGRPVGFVEMQPLLWLKNPTCFGENFQPAEGHIRVLVNMPKPRKELWLVTGSVENAFNTIGIPSTLYHLAAIHIGYYDPARRSCDRKDSAFWY
ncbi:hypothetical protein PHYSODRAFT_426047, partial [Phytophthora sojae]